MILNELSPNVSFDFEELSPTGYFQASVEVTFKNTITWCKEN